MQVIKIILAITCYSASITALPTTINRATKCGFPDEIGENLLLKRSSEISGSAGANHIYMCPKCLDYRSKNQVAVGNHASKCNGNSH
ncbi:hypothetical protein PpBr36_05573 [Pyricularia pennisetigena]|uniref:hypothetical protein n=1 Tax=Pyricularia pennisetigena TaxID=1578925 RepID=UPI00114E0948|nr:hypothetical protein PpBr36_05573 [Pyricularia pennisetigena]TLS26408.1 hypothetical protein PpBr36_05573 [Pyricularia pennisetigena]